MAWFKVHGWGSTTLSRVVSLGRPAHSCPCLPGKIGVGADFHIPLGAGQAPATALSGGGRVRSPTVEP
ncbi:MAG: hypothetical protein HY360_02620 [Verrucomicrobia bacterium]|nr:hypothetical protein [Verrucomicrobiota bacterium]